MFKNLTDKIGKVLNPNVLGALIVALIVALANAPAIRALELELVGEVSASCGYIPQFIEAIEVLDANPSEIFLASQNQGAYCGGGTPATIWKITLDPDTGEMVDVELKQSLDKIQIVRGALFESSDGTLFTGGGWCGYKPPYYSTDNGETWQSADTGPVHPPNSTYCYAELNGNVYAGTGYEPYTGQVYRWLGSGNWELVLDLGSVRNIVTSMAVYDNQLFVGSMAYGYSGNNCATSVPVYVSSDGNMFNPTTGIPNCYSVEKLLVVGNRLVARVQERSSPYQRYMYGWNNSSVMWEVIGIYNLEYGPIVSLNSALYAYGQAPTDTSAGIYQSLDFGQSWQQVAVLENPAASSMAVHGNEVYIGTSADASNITYLYRMSENNPPVADANDSYVINEGSSITFDASSSSDPDGDSLQYRWDFDNDGIWDTEWSDSPTANHTWNDDYSGTAQVEVYDGQLTDTATANVTVNNVPPTVGAITAPIDPVQVDTEITTNADFTDPGTLDTHTAIWDWDDEATSAGIVTFSNGSGSVSGSHTYGTPGVYEVTLTVTDDDGGSSQAMFQYIVIYDPNDGFVTGGGWINSPEGAYIPVPSLTGKANFGFVSKYKKGATVPSGQTEFQFKTGDLNFHSLSYEWLVVANHKAMYKGIGTINGTGNYGFQLSAIDAALTPSTDVDLFRIRIWNKDNADALVYDNQVEEADPNADPTTAIGGGSIVIHTSGAAAPANPENLISVVTVNLPQEFRLLQNYPNPFNPETWIPYQLHQPAEVVIRIYNSAGQLIRTLNLGPREAGFYLDRSRAAYWDGHNDAGEKVSSSVYFYQLQAGDFNATRRLVIVK